MSIQAGADFRGAIQHALSLSVACLVIIGPRWLSLVGERGQPRLYDPWDFVRLEIGTALARGMLVIPVLIDTRMPAARSGMKWAVIWALLGAIGCVVLLAIIGNALPDNDDPLAARASLAPPAAPVASVPAPPRPAALSLASITVCVAACGALAEQCSIICGGGNACQFCFAEGEKCKQQCSSGDCNPACSYNDRCQGLNDTSDPRDCCPPSVLNDPGDCARQLAPPTQAGP